MHTSFSYIRDPHNSNRVITIARQVNHENNSVQFAYTVCAPFHRDANKRPGDLFVKSKGRMIAEARLQCSRVSFTVPTLEGAAPLAAVMHDLATNDVHGSLVNSVVAAHLGA